MALSDEAGLRQLERDLRQARAAAGRRERFMLLDHLAALAEAHQPLPPLPVAGPERVQRLRTLRHQVRLSLGLSPWPRRTLLHAHTVGFLERDGYSVEKLVFEPRPGFVAPALLYMPQSAACPLPAVVYASGHFVEHGMAGTDAQCCCVSLARLGFAVLAYEAMGQGQRGVGWDEFRQTCAPAIERSERLAAGFANRGPDALRHWLPWARHCLQGEHGHLPPLLAGLSQLGLMVWESVRALDYLCTRPEVDATRLAVLGASGGGQNAYYTAAVDPRVATAVSICYLPSLTGQIKLSLGTNWWGGGDLCDQVPLHLTYGEFADVGALICPRPLQFVVGRQDDGFPISEARAEYARLAAFYEAAAPGRLVLAEVDQRHGLARPLREAAYGWLAQRLQGQGDGSPIAEPACEPEPPGSPALRCLAAGASVSTAGPLASLTKSLAAGWAARRQARASTPQRLPKLQEEIRRVLGCPVSAPALTREVLRLNRPAGGAALLAVEMGEGVTVWATLVQGGGPDRRPLVVIVHDGDGAGVWRDGWVGALLDQGCDVAILDTRGAGPDGLRGQRPADRLRALEEILLYKDESGDAFVTDFEVSTIYLMLGRSLLGERVGDLCRFVATAASWQGMPTAISCLGIGQGGMVALLAAVLEPRIAAVGAWHSPLSLQSLIVENPAFPASTFPFAVLRHFDLPEVLTCLAPRPVAIAHPCDGRAHYVSSEHAAVAYSEAVRVYEALGRSQCLHIVGGPAAGSLADICRILANGSD